MHSQTSTYGIPTRLCVVRDVANTLEILPIIKPRRMHEGYGSHFVSECVNVCVCYPASGYIPGLYIQSEAMYSLL